MWTRKQRIYFVSYKIILGTGEIYGAGTFKTIGLPKLGEWMEEIRANNSEKAIKFLAPLCCVEVDKDFIK